MKSYLAIVAALIASASAVTLQRGDAWPTTILPNSEPIDPLEYNKANPSAPLPWTMKWVIHSLAWQSISDYNVLRTKNLSLSWPLSLNKFSQRNFADRKLKRDPKMPPLWKKLMRGDRLTPLLLSPKINKRGKNKKVWKFDIRKTFYNYYLRIV